MFTVAIGLLLRVQEKPMPLDYCQEGQQWLSLCSPAGVGRSPPPPGRMRSGCASRWSASSPSSRITGPAGGRQATRNQSAKPHRQPGKMPAQRTATRIRSHWPGRSYGNRPPAKEVDSGAKKSRGETDRHQQLWEFGPERPRLPSPPSTWRRLDESMLLQSAAVSL